MGIIIDAQIVYSKCMPSVITAPLCMKFLIDLAAPCCVCPTLHSPILFITVLFILILRQSTMIEGALIVDSRRMMMSKTMMNSIGEWRVGQTQHGAAKSMRNLLHSGAVMTEGIHFEYTTWALIIVPISLIHSEHLCAYITEVLRATIGWSWQQTRCSRSHGNQMSSSI